MHICANRLSSGAGLSVSSEVEVLCAFPIKQAKTRRRAAIVVKFICSLMKWEDSCLGKRKKEGKKEKKERRKKT